MGAMLAQANRHNLSLEEYMAHMLRSEQWCRKCGRWLHCSRFHVDVSRHNGVKRVCIECGSTQTRPGPSLPLRAYMRLREKAWCRHCSAWLGCSEVRQGLCREGWSAYYRERYRTNADYRFRRRQHSYSRKRYGQVAPLPPEAARALLSKFRGKCAYCRKRKATTWDHIEPLAIGGQTIPGNVVPACVSCNSSKGARPLEEFLQRRGLTLSLDFMDVEALRFVGWAN
jgi:hypothetical protein